MFRAIPEFRFTPHFCFEGFWIFSVCVSPWPHESPLVSIQSEHDNTALGLYHIRQGRAPQGTRCGGIAGGIVTVTAPRRSH